MNIVIDFTNKLKSYSDILLCNEFTNSVEEALNICVNALKNNKVIYLCGNGGSFSQCLHFSAELTGSFTNKNDISYNCKVLSSNASHMSAVANDFGYDYIFSRELEGCARKGDVLIGISTSGKSQNVLEAFKIANKFDMQTIGILGNNKCDLCFTNVLVKDIKETDTIQEIHLIILHVLARQIRKRRI